MKEQRWWATAILIGAVIGLVCLPLGAIGTRLGVWGFQLGLGLVAIGAALGALALLTGFIALIVTFAKRLTGERATIAVALILSAVVVGVVGSQAVKGRGVPAIHDITTDTADPPQFNRVVALRGPDSNPLTYDAKTLPALQAEAYPDVQSLVTDESPGEIFSRARGVLDRMGLELVNVDGDAGVIEATDTTFWFGFKDDVVVRVRQADGGGSIVDIRSVSRVGVSDLGVNAGRIRAVLQELR
ncbi:MAG: DUF1499 domain-containing protein [Pseudomonadales bacterium]|nr:DUF1499 domain-containing protein [Pseudomonadales bacterium]MCP5184560.1 DUF1499 domain-containing protein [Pseudomonadales bacterium]